MTSPVARLENVGKQYGQQWALRNVNLTLSPGEIVGFIGPNGAGKTTLMRLLAGLSAPTEGKVTVLGETFHSRDLHTPLGIGLMLEQMGFIAQASGRENLEMLAGLQRIATKETITQTLVKVGLDPQDQRPVRAYSLGMRQRLCLAQALMEKPKLLLLDEPTNGLDPAGIVDLRKLLTDLAQEGTAIFLASHLLTEVERICQRVILVKSGRILEEVDLRIAGPTRVRVVISTASDEEKLRQCGMDVEKLPSESNLPTFAMTPKGSVPELVRTLVERGIDIEEVSLVRKSLEGEFLKLFG